MCRDHITISSVSNPLIVDIPVLGADIFKIRFAATSAL